MKRQANNAAIYYRLSRDDGGDAEFNSVCNVMWGGSFFECGLHVVGGENVVFFVRNFSGFTISQIL